MSASLCFTDVFFAKLIQDLSVNGTLFFTEKQLYYLLNRRIVQQRLRAVEILNLLIGFLGIAFFIVMMAIGLSLGDIFSGIARAAIIIPVMILVFGGSGWAKRKLQQQQHETFQVDRPTFLQCIQRWRQVNSMPKLLPPPHQEASPVAVSPEVSDYSFNRVVVCEHDSIAHLLIANNLHCERKCAVISLQGYPSRIFDTVMEMLQRNPCLSVYALYDASPAGVRLPEILRLDKWFPDPNITIYDLGLLPRQAMAINNPDAKRSDRSAQQASRIPERIRQTLSSEEMDWLLAGNYLELESFSPQNLLRGVSRGLIRSRQQPSVYPALPPPPRGIDLGIDYLPILDHWIDDDIG